MIVAGSFFLLVLLNFAWFWPIYTDQLLTARRLARPDLVRPLDLGSCSPAEEGRAAASGGSAGSRLERRVQGRAGLLGELAEPVVDVGQRARHVGRVSAMWSAIVRRPRAWTHTVWLGLWPTCRISASGTTRRLEATLGDQPVAGDADAAPELRRCPRSRRR